MNASRVWWHEWLLVNLSVNETKRCVRIPIKATAREPIKQAGYISATSAFHAQSLLRNAAGPPTASDLDAEDRTLITKFAIDRTECETSVPLVQCLTRMAVDLESVAAVKTAAVSCS